MKRDKVRLVSLLLLVLAAWADSASACPSCFASVTRKVLHTYYFSAIFLSLLPFGVFVAISLWLRAKRKNM